MLSPVVMVLKQMLFSLQIFLYSGGTDSLCNANSTSISFPTALDNGQQFRDKPWKAHKYTSSNQNIFKVISIGWHYSQIFHQRTRRVILERQGPNWLHHLYQIDSRQDEEKKGYINTITCVGIHIFNSKLNFLFLFINSFKYTFSIYKLMARSSTTG